MLKSFYQNYTVDNLRSFCKNLSSDLKSNPVLIQAFTAFYQTGTFPEQSPGPVLNGWRAYYEGNFGDAIRLFDQELKMDSEWHSYALLGLGKVASDNLWFDKSIKLLKQALHLARRENDFPRMSACYGALAEVAFRCGNYSLAYELVSLDRSLLAPGSEFEPRLNNYLAICAGRLGHYDWASMKLKANYFSTLQTDNTINSDYALANLFMCCWCNQKPLAEALELMMEHSFQAGDQYPRGVIALVRFWDAWDRAEVLVSQTHLEDASFHFSTGFAIEAECCRVLKCVTSSSQVDSLRIPSPGAHREQLSRIDSIISHVFDAFIHIETSGFEAILNLDGEPFEKLKRLTRSFYI